MSSSDAGSVSSFGSSHASFATPAHGPKPGETDPDDHSFWISGLFGVLYTVSKEKDRQTWLFVAFKLCLDALQLFLLTVNPMYGWNINASSIAWRVVSFIQLNQFMSDRGYHFFLACFYIMVVGLWAVVALSAWVGWSFSMSRFDYVWPIAVLRVYANIFFQVLEIASMTLLLMTLDCQYFDVPDGQQYIQQEFGVACWSMPHVVHVLVACVSLVVFVGLASLFQMAEMELNPLSRNALAMGHSRVELEGFLLKVVMTFASVFVTSYKWLSLVYFFGMLLLVRQYLMWQPHMTAWVNHVRVGSYAAVLYSAILLIPLGFRAADDMDTLSKNITVALWPGLVISALAGAAASFLRMRYFHVHVLHRFSAAPPGTKARLIYRFTDPREVEILSRCCRRWVDGDDEVLEPKAVALAEEVLKAGMALLPKNPYMIILYSSFLIDVQSSYQSGYTQLQLAKQADPSFLSQFAIYSREQQHTQKSSGAGEGAGGAEGQSVSLMSFVEFTRNYRLVVRVHREALMALRQFWQVLVRNKVALYDVTAAVMRVDTAVRTAERTYKIVMARHAQSVKIVRLYARFLEDVKQDPWNASKWFMEAEKLEQAEEDARNGNMFAELGIDPASADASALGALGELLNMKGGILGNHDERAVIVINAQAVVQLVNPSMEKMFGYSKNEIKGRNVNLIIPPPFAEPHTTFVRNYVATGNSSLMGREASFVALHKERYVFGVQLMVSKISGMAEDALFMGIITAKPSSPGATIWVMVGSEAVVSCDVTFTDWFGYRADELLGKGVDEWLVDPREIQDIFREAKGIQSGLSTAPRQAPRSASMGPFGGDGDADGAPHAPPPNTVAVGVPKGRRASAMLLQGSWTLSSAAVRHKYSGACTADVFITVGGIGSHKFFVCNVFLREEPRLMVVSDKTGRVVHASQALATALNTNVKAMLNNGSYGALQQMMPQPVSTLHTQLMAAPLGPGMVPPIYSCRSGALAVLLNVLVKDSPPAPTPFSLLLTKKELEGEQLFVSTLKQINMEQALDQRRIKLTVDLAGVVTGVLGGDSAVFGFAPGNLVGSQCSDFLDIVLDCATPPDGITSPSGSSSRPTLQKVLKAMAIRVRDAPGASFRVGVHSPTDLVDAMMVDDALQQALGLGIGGGRKPKPAIMTVSVHAGKSMSSEMPTVGSRGDTGADIPTIPPMSPATPARFGSATNAAAVTFVIELWRADISSGILEVDSAGYIIDSSHLALYPAGLMLGVPSESMVGKHVSHYLPITEEKPVTDMLQPSWGGGLGNAVAPIEMGPNGKWQVGVAGAKKKASSMKTSGVHGRGRHLVGATNLVSAPHAGDGQRVELIVQAVRKVATGSSMSEGNLYLVMRPKDPLPGRPDFAQWITAPPKPPPSKATRARVNSSTSYPNPSEPTDTVVIIGNGYANGQANGFGSSKHSFAAPKVPQLPQPSTTAAARRASAEIRGVDDSLPGVGSDGRLPVPAADEERGDDEHLSIQSPNSDDDRKHGRGSGSSDGAPAKSVFQAPVPGDRISQWVMSGGQMNGDRPSGERPVPPGSPPAGGRKGRRGSGLRNSMDSAAKRGTGGDPGGDPEEGGMSGGKGRRSSWTRSGPALAVYDGEEEDDEEEEDRDSPGSLAQDEDDSPGFGLGGDGGDGGGGAMPESDRHSSSEPTQPMESDHAEVVTDYRRGHRFKALMRMLSSDKAQGAMRRFSIHSYIVVVFMLVVHVALFVLQKELLAQQQEGVDDLYSVGIAAKYVGQIMHSTMEMNVILDNMTVPSLFRISSRNDLPEARALYRELIDSMAELHQGVYFGFNGKSRRMPDKYGLRQLWDQSTLVVTDYYDAVPTPKLSVTNMSLWVLGNTYLARASNIWLNGEAYTAVNGSIENWTDFKFMLNNGPLVMMQGYYDTMDAFLQLVIEQADQINSSQMIALIMEGVVVSSLGIIYITILARSVTHARFDLYSVFMMVPIGLIRALATQPIILDEDDEEAAEEAAAQRNGQTGVALGATLATGGGGGGGDVEAGEGKKDKSGLKVGVRMAVPITPRAPGGGDAGDAEAGGGGGALKGVLWGKDVGGGTRRLSGPSAEPGALGDFMSQPGAPPPERGSGDGKPGAPSRIAGYFAVVWRWIQTVFMFVTGRRSNEALAATAPTSAKRKLSSTPRFALWLIWPFMLWAVVNISINARAQSMLSDVAGPIATFNLVNSLSARFQRTFYYAMALVVSDDYNARELYRYRLLNVSLPRLKVEYAAMLGGSEAVPTETAPHFTLATQGVLYSGGKGVGVLFAHECLRDNQTDCMTTDDIYFEYASGGFDRLMRRSMDMFAIMGYSEGSYPMLNGSEWDFLWNTQDDMDGGLQALVDAFHNHVKTSYTSSGILHSVNLAISAVITLCYALFILRPFIKELQNETRRVAELLSQLPAEIAVEELVAKVLMLNQNNNGQVAPGGAAPSSKMSMKSGGSIKMGGSMKMGSLKM